MSVAAPKRCGGARLGPAAPLTLSWWRDCVNACGFHHWSEGSICSVRQAVGHKCDRVALVSGLWTLTAANWTSDTDVMKTEAARR